MQTTRFPRRALQPKRLTLALAAAWPALALAAPASDSAYRTDAQSTHVEDATSKGIGTVNMITCIMSALRADALVNQGNYLALVDESKCDNNRASADNSSGSSSNAPSYMHGIVNSTRATNSDPMRMKAWLSMPQDGQGMTIFVNLTATTAPSDTNPYGDFRIDYCGQPDAMPGQCMMNGYLIGGASGIQYFEVERGGGGGGGGGQSIKQLALTRSGADGGSGRLSYAEDGNPQAYSFAYDAAHFLRSNGTQEQCFSRLATEADASVWRYGLYDSSTGARITRNSGFPIEYLSGAGTVRGYMGYWGLSVPGDAAAPANGDTVYKVDYGNNGAVKTAYTYAGAAGRLTKYSKTTKPLVDIDGVRFTLWVNDRSEVEGGGNHSPGQYEIYWKQDDGNFVVAGTMDCNNGPCVTRDATSDVRIAASYFSTRGGVRGFSQALGGSCSSRSRTAI